MLILGINEGFDSAVVVLKNGKILFALQEERVTRVKNMIGFPVNALKFTLDYLDLKPQDFTAVCLSNLESPLITKQQFLADYDRIADQSQKILESNMRRLIQGAKDMLPESIKQLKRQPRVKEKNDAVERHLSELGFDLSKVKRTEHHFNHAASAYFGVRKNFKEKHLVLTLDGGGDRCCSHVYLAENGKMKLIAKTPDGHSIGNIYSRVTHFMGMTPHEHEYKLMGLAAYLKDEKHIASIVDRFRSYVDLDPANPLIFQCKVPEKTYAIQPRLALDFKRTRFDNLAAGLQVYTEELIVRWVQAAIKATGVKNVVCAGGVFMNVKANKRIAELPEVEYFDVFPSCGDETLPFGAVWSEYSDSSDTHGADIVFDKFCLGTDAGYDLEQAQKEYSNEFSFEKLESPTEHVAKLIADGNIVARCVGPMEFGARALGNRSILSDPSRVDVVPEINKMIKQRDFWMPFAPAMLQEKAETYIKVPKSLPQKTVSPHMMHTFDTTEKRGDLVAGTHSYDHTARAQIVSQISNSGFHDLISAFAKISGKAVVLNTSFNQHGYPIVMGTCDAIQVMQKSTLKYLLVNDVLVTKRNSLNIRPDA